MSFLHCSIAREVVLFSLAIHATNFPVVYVELQTRTTFIPSLAPTHWVTNPVSDVERSFSAPKHGQLRLRLFYHLLYSACPRFLSVQLQSSQ